MWSSDFRWLGEMGSLFLPHGLKHMAKPWTDMQIKAMEDVMETFIIPAVVKDSKASAALEK